MKTGVNWIENQGENSCKKSKICYIIYFVDKVDQDYVHVSLDVNVIETTRFFSKERGGQSDRVKA